MLYRPSTPPTTTTPTPTPVTGRALAYGCRSASATERAFVGADLHFNRTPLTSPTLGQCSLLVGVCKRYVAAAASIADDPDAVRAVLAGKIPLLNTARPSNGESLAAHIRRSNPDELLKAARDVGVTILWDAMIEPLLV